MDYKIVMAGELGQVIVEDESVSGITSRKALNPKAWLVPLGEAPQELYGGMQSAFKWATDWVEVVPAEEYDGDDPAEDYQETASVFEGGPTSGNWAHKSVKGQRGGSAPGGGHGAVQAKGLGASRATLVAVSKSVRAARDARGGADTPTRIDQPKPAVDAATTELGKELSDRWDSMTDAERDIAMKSGIIPLDKESTEYLEKAVPNMPGVVDERTPEEAKELVDALDVYEKEFLPMRQAAIDKEVALMRQSTDLVEMEFDEDGYCNYPVPYTLVTTPLRADEAMQLMTKRRSAEWTKRTTDAEWKRLQEPSKTVADVNEKAAIMMKYEQYLPERMSRENMGRWSAVRNANWNVTNRAGQGTKWTKPTDQVSLSEVQALQKTMLTVAQQHRTRHTEAPMWVDYAAGSRISRSLQESMNATPKLNALQIRLTRDYKRYQGGRSWDDTSLLSMNKAVKGLATVQNGKVTPQKWLTDVIAKAEGKLSGKPDASWFDKAIGLRKASSADTNAITKNIMDTHDTKTHGSFKPTVHGVFQIVHPKSQQDAYDKTFKDVGNVQQGTFFHGTSSGVSLAIAAKGYRPSASGMMGPGVYLAKASSKSAQYVEGGSANGFGRSRGARGAMMINRAAFDTMVTDQPNHRTAKTVFGKKDGQLHLRNDEWVVRDPYQSQPLFIVDYERR